MYKVSSNFTPFVQPGMQIISERPTLELAIVIAQDLAHTPLTVQFGESTAVQCSAAAAANSYLVAGIPSGKRLREALSSKISCEQSVRPQNHPNLLEFRTCRPSVKGLLIKGHGLCYQLTHAAAAGQALVREGLAANNLTVIGPPLTAVGVNHIITQAAHGHTFFVHTHYGCVDSGRSHMCDNASYCRHCA